MVRGAMGRKFGGLSLLLSGRLSVTMILAVLVCLFSVDTSAQTSAQGYANSNLRLVRTIGNDDERIRSVAFTPLNELVIFSQSRSNKDLLFIKNGEEKHTIPLCKERRFANWAIDERAAILVANCYDFSADIWDIVTGKFIRKLNTDPRKGDFRFYSLLSSEAGRIVFVFDTTAELWDIAEGKKVANLTTSFRYGINQSIYDFDFSPDGKVIAIAYGSLVSLWNAQDGELIHRLVDHEISTATSMLTDNGIILSLAFSPDGKTVFTGSGASNTSKAWDIATGKLLQTFKKHRQYVSAIAVSPDGRVLATGSRNQDAKLWGVATGKQLFSLDNRKEVRRLSFNPDGTRLMSMTSTHYFIWNVSTGQKLDEVPISDISKTRFSEDWKYVLLPDSKNKTVGLYEYLGR